MGELTKQLDTTTTTQEQVHKDNVTLRRSFKQKERELENSQQGMISQSAHDELRVQNDELQETLAAEQRANASKAAEIQRLKTTNSSLKQELLQTQQKTDGIRAELDEMSGKVETSSKQVHSLQRELQEKERGNESLHQTLQKFISEQQETLEENAALKRELASKELDQKTAKQSHDRLRKQSTSLQHQQQQRERELTELTRQQQEVNEAMAGLRMDKESLTEQLKRAQEEVGGWQVTVRGMKQSLTSQREEHAAEKQSQEQRVSFRSQP